MKDGKLGVAMMGPGRIVHRVMQDFRNAENCELIGMASRSPGARRGGPEGIRGQICIQL